jgi:hypothetical protein
MDYLIRFSIEEWVPFVAPNAMFNESQSMNCGFAVDVWRPNHFGSGTDVLTNLPVNNIFSGINADLAVREKDAWLHRLATVLPCLGRSFLWRPHLRCFEGPVLLPLKGSLQGMELVTTFLRDLSVGMREVN